MTLGPSEDGSNGEAHLPIGIPTGTRVPTSPLAAANILPSTHKNADKNTKGGAGPGRGNANNRGR